MSSIEKKHVHLASCHCRGVVLEVDLAGPHGEPIRCNCSLCRRRGAAMIFIDKDSLRVKDGSHLLKKYEFGTHIAQHYFCSVCGVYTHHRRRADPNQYAVNIGCFEETDLIPGDNIKLFDGAHHPLDTN